MNATSSAPSPGPEDSSALFTYLVMQQSSMATMLLGKAPNPETGKTTRDLDAARFFIDQLEMLETKTKGNLTKEETALLKQTLMNLRLAYVEAVEQPAEAPQPAAAPKAAEVPKPAEAAASQPGAAEEEHAKKFTKKY